jgi:hypothetical protein
MYQVFVRSVLPKLKYFMWTHVHTCGKGKVHPKTDHEDPEEVYRYNSTLSLTSALDGGGWSMPHPGCLTPNKKELVPIVQEAWWAPRMVRTIAENLIPTGTQFPDSPACSKSLY